ncbi:MAG: translation elongation factor Ts [Lachnospirales bacterium]
MAVTAAKIKKLREITGAGMSDCKNALVESDGDIDKAIELLREKGLAAAAKKAGRDATEGVVKTGIFGNVGVIVEINSETDFVAKNDEFVNYVNQVVEHVAKSNASNMDELMNEKWLHDSSLSVAEALSSKIAVIGENLSIRRFVKVNTNGVLVDYIHAGGKVGVLLELNATANDAVTEAGKNVCMQIAAMSPMFLDRSEISDDFLVKETEILRQQALNEGKSGDIVENMVKGRLKKQLKEYCLLDQEYVKAEGKETIEDYLKAISKEVGSEVSVNSFVRYETGEGLEKKEENFADEVNKVMQN